VKALAILPIITSSAFAQPAIGIGVDERGGVKLPLDLPFTEAAGRRVELGDFFDGKRPVLLVLAYIRCKMLCSLVLQQTTQAVREMPLALGQDYRVVTVSIDPEEEAAIANERRADLLARAGHAGETDRWTFLLGGERPIRELADTLGFHYRWDEHSEQFAHPAVLFVIAPDGTISRYLQGLDVAPATVAAALQRAALGATSKEPLVDSVLACFRDDSAARARREKIDVFLEVGGGFVGFAVGSSLVGFAFWGRRRRRYL
jgi:protein SCO1/2